MSLTKEALPAEFSRLGSTTIPKDSSVLIPVLGEEHLRRLRGRLGKRAISDGLRQRLPGRPAPRRQPLRGPTADDQA